MRSRPAPSFSEARRMVIERTAPQYQRASLAQKGVLLDSVIAVTGYARKYAITLLNHPSKATPARRRPRQPAYGHGVQHALWLAWEASHHICAKRLIPFLPTLLPVLEQQGYLHLNEEHRSQLLTMSAATADRLLQSHRSPPASTRSLSLTQAGPLLKQQIPLRLFHQWDDAQPGFLEADLVAHCATSAQGSFLSTLTLTDVATGWTKCLPLLFRSPEAIQAALGQARALFPFPILGIDTDNGKEFINETILAYCQREQLTFTRGREGVKNDQCYVEEKNGAVVHHFVGSQRLEGEGAYLQLRELYRALRLYINCFQPSMKLQAKETDGERIRRIYDPAKTPLQRLLLSGVLPDAQQEDLRTVAQTLDPIRLLAHFKELHQALVHQADPAHDASLVPFRAARFLPSPLLLKMGQPTEPAIERPSSLPLSPQEELSEQNPLDCSATTRDPFEGVWPTIRSLVLAHPTWSSGNLFQEVQRLFPNRFRLAHLGTLQRRLRLIRAHLLGLMEGPCPHELIQAPRREDTTSQDERHAPSRDQHAPALVALPAPSPQVPQAPPLLPPSEGEQENSGATGQAERTHPSEISQPASADKPMRLVQTIEGGILRYLEHLKTSGRLPKTLEWHRSALGSFQQYLTEHCHHRLLSHLSQGDVRGWTTFLGTSRTASGTVRSTSTIATYLRSVRAFCHWAQRQGYLRRHVFAPSMIPKVPKKTLRLVEPEEFDRLLQACGPSGEDNEPQGWACARNRAILWVLLDTGLRVSELCALRLEDVDREAGRLHVGGNRSRERSLSLSPQGWQHVCLYLDQYRCACASATAERVGGTFLFLTETFHPLTKNALTFLFARLRQRTGLPHAAVRPSSLRDTCAVRALQAGTSPQAVLEQLGLREWSMITRYQCHSQAGAERPTAKAPPAKSRP